MRASVFRQVQTAVSGGMPWSSVQGLRVPKSTLTVERGWTLTFTGEEVYASSCPAATLTKGKLVLPKGPAARIRCGT